MGKTAVLKVSLRLCALRIFAADLTRSAIQTLIVPAVVSLILFLASTYIIVPVWRRARDRYSQYIPVDTITNQTFSLRDRVSNGFSGMMARPFWRRGASQQVAIGDDDGLSDDGEELANVHPSTRRAMETNARNQPDSTRRLSRE